MPRRKSGEPDTNSFGPDMKWSPEARARRSEAAKKAAATRKANQAAKLGERNPGEGPEIDAFFAKPKYPYYQGSRLARLLCRTASPLALFAATWRVRARGVDDYFRTLLRPEPRKYVLSPSRKKRPFRFA